MQGMPGSRGCCGEGRVQLAIGGEEREKVQPQDKKLVRYVNELSKAMVTNQVISEMREVAKRELAAIHFGMCEDLQ